jgi:hypothetical protein
MERVSVIRGDLPVLIIAPHGFDDSNTDYLAERVAKELGAYAVINRGWQRSDKVDYWNDQANCNDIRHCQQDVVREEFLEPIQRFVTRINKDYGYGQIFVIHGVGNDVRTKKQYARDLDMIVGYGAGEPPSYSCDPRLKDAFIHLLISSGVDAYEGDAGGAYSGRAKNNLNQLYRRWYPHNHIHSMQVEVVYELRADREICRITGAVLADCIDDLLEYDDSKLLDVAPNYRCF